MTDSAKAALSAEQSVALENCVARVAQMLVGAQRTLATAESCTGGMIAAALTSMPGSSRWFERGFVTYSNAAKVDMLGVSPRTLESEGAVSEPTAAEMAAGAIARSGADVSVAVTGIAGPGGGSERKPVGTVCISWCQRGHRPTTRTFDFAGDRHEVRRASVLAALEGLLEMGA